MPVWDSFVTEDDRKVIANGNLRTPTGPGRKNALLVIDMQVTACGYDQPIHEQLHIFSGACGTHAYKAIPVQQRLLEAARRADMPIIYSKHVFRPETGLPQSEPGNNFSVFNKNSEIQEEVAMQAGDLLIEKQTPSCFVFTNLIQILSNLEVDGLLVVGNSTSGCVRATCVDGAAYGYKMTVVEEGVFDRIEMSHAAALFDMQFKICDVVAETDAMKIIQGGATVSANPIRQSATA